MSRQKHRSFLYFLSVFGIAPWGENSEQPRAGCPIEVSFTCHGMAPSFSGPRMPGSAAFASAWFKTLPSPPSPQVPVPLPNLKPGQLLLSSVIALYGQTSWLLGGSGCLWDISNAAVTDVTHKIPGDLVRLPGRSGELLAHRLSVHTTWKETDKARVTASVSQSYGTLDTSVALPGALGQGHVQLLTASGPP